MNIIRADPGSFKDPDAGVLHYGDRVYRYFTPDGAGKFEALGQSGLLKRLVADGKLIEAQEISAELTQELKEAVPNAALIVEHPRLPFVSYCYEWPFEMLQSAALLYLNVLRAALDMGYTLKYASPYNIQFLGPDPVMIDVASFEPYTEGEPWSAYNEFCRLFLNPLLFQSSTAVPFHRWLRGSLRGIEPAELSRLLPWRQKFRPKVFTNVVLQAWLERKFGSTTNSGQPSVRPRIGKNQLLKLITGVEKIVAGLKPGNVQSQWGSYDAERPYSQEATAAKEGFVEQVLKAQEPDIVWDLGCNTGRYSLIAAKYAKHVIALDGDPYTVASLYQRVRESHPNVLPLVMDLVDPSPDRGWAQEERRGILQRGPADMVLALALVHHLAISGNIPLTRIMAWLSQITRAGIIEFVPKEDPALQRLLRWRGDVYGDYTQESFERALQEHFQLTGQCSLPDSGRVLYSFIRSGNQAD